MQAVSSNIMINQDHNCPVCLTVLLDPIQLKKCKHLFCQRCIQDSYELSGTKKCPLCRAQFNQKDLIAVIQLRKQLQTLYPKLLQEKRKMQSTKRVIRVIVGNTTKILNTNQDNKYDWNFYVKQAKGQVSLNQLASKIQIHLHPTFHPPVLSFSQIPKSGIQISRLGWGTFQIITKIFWKKQLGGGFSSLSHYLQWKPKKQKQLLCHILIPPQIEKK